VDLFLYFFLEEIVFQESYSEDYNRIVEVIATGEKEIEK
jgi:hypothetical protein